MAGQFQQQRHARAAIVGPEIALSASRGIGFEVGERSGIGMGTDEEALASPGFPRGDEIGRLQELSVEWISQSERLFAEGSSI